jgi:hypothetical protein
MSYQTTDPGSSEHIMWIHVKNKTKQKLHWDMSFLSYRKFKAKENLIKKLKGKIPYL